MGQQLKAIKDALHKYADAKRAQTYQWFFKTGKGEYGEGDVFIGVTMPLLRRVSRTYKDADEKTILALLHSQIHEERMLALCIWVLQFEGGDDTTRKHIYSQYLKHRRYINNWDLVDVSVYKIVGAYLYESPDRSCLDTLARSQSMWDRRIAIVATMFFIRQGQFDDTLQLSTLLLHDTHDLIHKAVGWMLREVGKREEAVLTMFLKQHYTTMPRTMLRYAIERLPETERQAYLHGDV
jgi:3-methyladenine DNA glycosylase AlkD